MTIDTIFMCFCEDCDHNDGIEKPYFMSTGLMVSENLHNISRASNYREYGNLNFSEFLGRDNYCLTAFSFVGIRWKQLKGSRSHEEKEVCRQKPGRASWKGRNGKLCDNSRCCLMEIRMNDVILFRTFLRICFEYGINMSHFQHLNFFQHQICQYRL